MNSAVSFSTRSAASPTDLFTRAEASSTFRLKSLMLTFWVSRCKKRHAMFADARLGHYFVEAPMGQPGSIANYTPAVWGRALPRSGGSKTRLHTISAWDSGCENRADALRSVFPSRMRGSDRYESPLCARHRFGREWTGKQRFYLCRSRARPAKDCRCSCRHRPRELPGQTSGVQRAFL